MNEQEKKIQTIVLTMMKGDLVNGNWVNHVITHTDINGHQIGQHWVAIMASNGDTLLYKSEDIKQIRITETV